MNVITILQCLQCMLSSHFRQLIHTLWDLAGYFGNDTAVQSALNRMLSALGEAAKYHAILVDQAARAITKNLAGFIKRCVAAPCFLRDLPSREWT